MILLIVIAVMWAVGLLTALGLCRGADDEWASDERVAPGPSPRRHG
jgi:hypothetical protein